MNLTELREEARQYSELTEDEMVAMLAEMAEVYAEQLVGIPAEMAKIALALKARHDATAPARRSVGEYLRQKQIQEDRYREDLRKQEEAQAEGRRYYGTPKKPEDVVDQVRTDEYAGTGVLKISELRQVVAPLVRDSKAQFYAIQEERLAVWQTRGLPEKQAALLKCIAEGHITAHSSGSYSGRNLGFDADRCVCARPDGRTMGALIKKGVVGVRSGLGFNSLSTLMLKKPE